MLDRFFKAFLDKYTCEVCRKYQATHGLLCVYCHLDTLLTSQDLQPPLKDTPAPITAAIIHTS